MEVAQYFLDKDPMVALLILAILGLVTFIKIVDSRNMKVTNERIGDLKQDLKEVKEENKADKNMFMKAISCFSKSTEEFRQVGKDLSDIKTDIKNIDKELTTIKTKIEK